MLNDIVQGIADALVEEFGEDTVIYTDEKEQGFKEPCFFISNLSASKEQVVGNRYFRDYSFIVHYFPEKNSSEERNDVLERLQWSLENIYIGESKDMIRGTKMKSENSDGVLLFFVSYNAFAYKEEEKVEMEELIY